MNKVKLIFAAFTVVAPIHAEAATKGSACPEILTNTMEESTLTLLSQDPMVSIRLNGGKLENSTINFSNDLIKISKGSESTEIAIDYTAGFTQAYAENVIGDGFDCSVTLTTFGEKQLLLSCEDTTVSLNDKEVLAMIKDSNLRKAEKWCESTLELQAPTP
jgi:hypothetical protein